MIDAFIDSFLKDFDDSQYPQDFLQEYEVLECFSHNELGETFLVKQRETQHFYVAKCYPKKLNHDSVTESNLLKSAQHEGLPRFKDEYENGETLCVVRTYVQGKTLDQFVQEYSISPRLAVSIIIQICEILDYLHSQTPPIIHRDIKPQNIIINSQGKITLIDFGISRAYHADSQTDTCCLGTRYYAAPEQYGFAQTDQRSDIYSLGILLFWILTGSVEVQKLDQIKNHRIKKVIKKCTAFDPKDRFQKITQVRDELTGRNFFHKIILSTAVVFLMLLGSFLYLNPAEIPSQPIQFQEPLIEKAVRLQLGKTASEKISEQDLLSVHEVYVFGDQAALNEETYTEINQHFVKNDGVVSRGTIVKLDDLAKLKNLRHIALGYQQITDLTPLSNLPYLENIDFRHNPIQDVAPLSRITSITTLTLFDTGVSDLTALEDCHQLSTLDIGFTSLQTMDAFDGLSSLRVLMIRKGALQSLDHIETTLPLLEKIYLADTQVGDLTPLLNLPHLQFVELSENMRPLVNQFGNQEKFQVIYHQE